MIEGVQILETRSAERALRAAIAQREAEAPRAPGLHLSTIVDDYYATLFPKQLDYGDADLGLKEAFWEFGTAWETTIATGLTVLHPTFVKPEPVLCDRVTCSADGKDTDRGEDDPRIHEIKLTWTSSRDGLAHPKVQKFVGQGLAYCRAHRSTRLDLHIGYVRGNYKERLVDVVTYRLLAERAAVVEHWRRLMQHAEDRGWR